MTIFRIQNLATAHVYNCIIHSIVTNLLVVLNAKDLRTLPIGIRDVRSRSA